MQVPSKFFDQFHILGGISSPSQPVLDAVTRSISALLAFISLGILSRNNIILIVHFCVQCALILGMARPWSSVENL